MDGRCVGCGKWRSNLADAGYGKYVKHCPECIALWKIKNAEAEVQMEIRRKAHEEDLKKKDKKNDKGKL